LLLQVVIIKGQLLTNELQVRVLCIEIVKFGLCLIFQSTHF
jgi:hypothetical protein